MSLQKTMLELYNIDTQEWETQHEGIDLLHPEKYPVRLAARGKVGRATVMKTGEVFQALPEPEKLPVCIFCSTQHEAPHDGTCLL